MGIEAELTSEARQQLAVQHLDVELRAARPLSLALLCALIWTIARLAIPVLTGEAIDRAIDVPGGPKLDLLLALVLAVGAMAAVQGGAAAFRRYFAMRTSYRVETDLRGELYDRVNRLSFDYYDRTATGQLMSRGSTDLHEIQFLVVLIPINTAFLMMAVGAFFLLLRVHVALAVLAVLMLVLPYRAFFPR